MARRSLFKIRKPSLRKKIAARTSAKRFVRHSLGVKAPRGMGWATNPKRYVQNKSRGGLLGFLARLFR